MLPLLCWWSLTPSACFGGVHAGSIPSYPIHSRNAIQSACRRCLVQRGRATLASHARPTSAHVESLSAPSRSRLPCRSLARAAGLRARHALLPCLGRLGCARRSGRYLRHGLAQTAAEVQSLAELVADRIAGCRTRLRAGSAHPPAAHVARRCHSTASGRRLR